MLQQTLKDLWLNKSKKETEDQKQAKKTPKRVSKKPIKKSKKVTTKPKAKKCVKSKTKTIPKEAPPKTASGCSIWRLLCLPKRLQFCCFKSAPKVSKIESENTECDQLFDSNCDTGANMSQF